jgi:hypothetical protein
MGLLPKTVVYLFGLDPFSTGFIRLPESPETIARKSHLSAPTLGTSIVMAAARSIARSAAAKTRFDSARQIPSFHPSRAWRLFSLRDGIHNRAIRIPVLRLREFRAPGASPGRRWSSPRPLARRVATSVTRIGIRDGCPYEKNGLVAAASPKIPLASTTYKQRSYTLSV